MDWGFGIREKSIPDPGSRGQKGTGYLIPDPQHWIQPSLNYHSRYVSCPNLFPSLTYLHVKGGGITTRRQQKERGVFQYILFPGSVFPVPYDC